MKYQLCLIATLSCFSLAAQPTPTPSWRLSAESSFLLAGPANTTYDFLVGAGFEHQRKLNNRSQLLLGANLSTNIPTPGARVYVSEAQLGLRFDLSPRKKYNGFFIEANAGLMYWNEQLAINLIDREVRERINHFGLSGELNLGYRVFNNLVVQVGIKQLGLKATGIGLGIGLDIR